MQIDVKSYIYQFTFCQLISHISCSIYTRVMKIGSINCFFTSDSAEPFRFNLRCLEAEIWPSEHVANSIIRTLPLKVVPGRFMVAIFQRNHGFAQLVKRDFPIFFQDEVKFLVQLLQLAADQGQGDAHAAEGDAAVNSWPDHIHAALNHLYLGR